MENKKELIKVEALDNDVQYVAVGMKETDDGLRVHTEGSITGANTLEAIEALCTEFLKQEYFPDAISSSMLCAAVDKAIKAAHGITPISDAMSMAAKAKLGDDYDELMGLLGDVFGVKKAKKAEKKAEPEEVVEKVEENVENRDAVRVTIERVKGGKKA